LKQWNEKKNYNLAAALALFSLAIWSFGFNANALSDDSTDSLNFPKINKATALLFKASGNCGWISKA